MEWERQKGEGKKAYQAFTAYLQMGTKRSHAKVAAQLRKSTALMNRWSRRWSWVARVEAWEAEQERIEREEWEKQCRGMAKRHANAALLFQQKALHKLAQLNPDELSPGDLIKWMVEAAKLERLSRGESTENVKQEVAGKVAIEHGEEWTRRILDDPNACELATRLLERITNGPADAGGPGLPGK